MSLSPATPFYWKDWADDLALASCSWAAQGVWLRVLGKLHQSPEYGVLRWPLKQIAQTAGVPHKFLRELAQKNVLKGGDKFDTDFIHVPRHAGRALDPVVLVKADGGSCWFSARFVRDRWRNNQRGASSRFTPNNQPNRSPTRRLGDQPGDGPAFAFAFASGSLINSAPESINRAAAELARALHEIGYSECSPNAPDVQLLATHGVTSEELKAAARGKEGKPLAYLVTRVLAKRQDAAAGIDAQPAPRAAVDPVARAVAEERWNVEAELADIVHRRDRLQTLTADAAAALAAPLRERLAQLGSTAAGGRS